MSGKPGSIEGAVNTLKRDSLKRFYSTLKQVNETLLPNEIERIHKRNKEHAVEDNIHEYINGSDFHKHICIQEDMDGLDRDSTVFEILEELDPERRQFDFRKEKYICELMKCVPAKKELTDIVDLVGRGMSRSKRKNTWNYKDQLESLEKKLKKEFERCIPEEEEKE
jgi:hypothetical protein